MFDPTPVSSRSLFSKLRRVIHYRVFAVFVILIGLSLVFYYLSKGRFFDPLCIGTILTRAPEYGILAVGVTFLMISQELDISVGSVFTFCSLMYAIFWITFGLNPILALFLSLSIGTLIGGFNGLITLKFGIPSVITTLGTMYLWRGVALVICAGSPIHYGRGPGRVIPFEGILLGKIGGFFPMQLVWFIIITVIFEIILHYHRFGNRIRATGGNRLAAEEMGINTGMVKLICFLLLGFLTAFAAIVESIRVGEGSARLGVGYEFYAIGATVIGGTSLFGGVGTVIGTFLGAILLEMIRAGLMVIGISGWWFNVFIGAVIIVVMIMKVFIRGGTRR